MTNPPGVVAIDGGVGSGKTTAAHGVSERLAAQFIPEYFDLIPVADHNAFRNLSPLARLRRLLSTEAERRNRIRNTASGTAVLDRSVLSIAAHEFAMATIAPDDCVRDLPTHLTPASVIFPTTHIVLVADDATRRWRCAERSSSMPDLFLSPRYNDLLYTFFHQVASGLPLVFIDTNRPITADVVTELYTECMTTAPIRAGAIVEAIANAWPF